MRISTEDLSLLPPHVRAQIQRQTGIAHPVDQPAKRWSPAIPTFGCLRCGGWGGAWSRDGSCPDPACAGPLRRFGSRMEARVHQRLRAALKPGQRLYCQVRLPLFTIAPEDGGVPMYLTVDFAVVDSVQALRLIDAKGKRVSRDWRRGAAAAGAWYGKIEEVSE